MMALFAEGRKETAELRKSMAERDARADERFARIEARMDERDAQAAERDARADERFARIETGIASLRVVVEETNRSVGSLTRKLGGVIESIVLPDIVGKFNEKGFKFDSVSTRVEFLNEKKNGKLAEIDALLENGKFVIAVETKTDMELKDVKAHAKRLETLRGLSRFKGKKIYGALATAITRKKTVDYALDQGFYVLQQPDVMGVKILDFPKGRSAKAW
jgi:hypothetical protein